MNFVAPGVFVREIDFSLYAPALSTTIFGCVTTAPWGKINDPVFVSTHPNMLSNFGYPSDGHYGMYASLEYLKRGTMSWVVRVDDGTAIRADSGDDVVGEATKAFVESGNTQPFVIDGADVAKLEGLEVAPFTITVGVNDQMKIKVFRDGTPEAVEDVTLTPGTYNTFQDIVNMLQPLFSGNLEWYDAGTGIGVKSIGTHYGDDTKLYFYSAGGDIYNATYDTFFDVSGWTYALSDGDGGYEETLGTDGNNELEINFGDITGGPYPGAITPFTVVFGTPGVVGQSFTAQQIADAINTTIGIAGDASVTQTNSIKISHATGGDDYYVEIPSAGTTANGIFGFALDTPAYGDPVDSTCIKIYGLYKGSEGNTLKVYLSDAYKKTYSYAGYEKSFKLSIYHRDIQVEEYDNLLAWDGIGVAPEDWYITRIGTPDGQYEPQSSQVSKWIMVEDVTTAYPTYNTGTIYTLGTGTGAVGTDGNDSGNPNDLISAYIIGIDKLKSSSTYDINLLACPGIYDTSVFLHEIEVCETRADCMTTLDTPPGLSPEEVVAWHNGLGSGNTTPINSSYAAIYWPWVEVYDQFTKQDIWVPPSGHVAQVYAYTDYISETWFAPAGFNRAHLLNIKNTEYPNISQGEMELLYGNQNAVNPIIKFIPDGFTIWGQKTAFRTPSSRDRVNVRRLLLYSEKVISTAVKYLNFEPNDDFTWRWFTRLVGPVFSSIQARRGLYEYKVICDETTNTPDIIDNNTMAGFVYLKPTKVAEAILVNFVLVETGASFEEIIG